MYLGNYKAFIVKIFFIVSIGFFIGVKLLPWPDNDVYLEYFYRAHRLSYSQILFESVDPFFLVLNKIFPGSLFLIFTILLSIFTLILKFFVINKKYHFWPRIVFLYSSYLLWLHDYVQIRVALALAFFLFGWLFVKKPFFKFMILGLACATHISVFILVCFFISHKYFGTTKVIVFSILLTFFMSNFLFSGHTGFYKIDDYINLLNAGYFSQINLFALMPVLQVVVVLYILFIEKYRKIFFQRVEFAASVQSVLFFYLLLKIPVFSYRLSELFLVFFVIVLSELSLKSKFSNLIYFLFFLVGIKTSFFGDNSLFLLFN